MEKNANQKIREKSRKNKSKSFSKKTNKMKLFNEKSQNRNSLSLTNNTNHGSISLNRIDEKETFKKLKNSFFSSESPLNEKSINLSHHLEKRNFHDQNHLEYLNTEESFNLDDQNMLKKHQQYITENNSDNNTLNNEESSNLKNLNDNKIFITQEERLVLPKSLSYIQIKDHSNSESSDIDENNAYQQLYNIQNPFSKTVLTIRKAVSFKLREKNTETIFTKKELLSNSSSFDIRICKELGKKIIKTNITEINSLIRNSIIIINL